MKIAKASRPLSSGAQQAAEQPAPAPGEHLPRRVRALAEEEVRGERGERTDGEAPLRAKRHAGRRDEHGDGLHARDRREEDPAGGGEAAERRDERQVPCRHRPALEPGEPGGDDGERREEHGDAAAVGIERRPGREGERGGGAERDDSRRQAGSSSRRQALVLFQH